MILGLGIDLINVDRIKALKKEFGNKFNDKLFTENENKIAAKFHDNQPRINAYYAKRFAAKEAFSKALGTGIGRGVNFKDIEILNDIHGKPYIKLYEKTSKFIEETFKKDIQNIQIDLSIADDHPLATAIVIISQINL